jgi:hypothetical protein
MNIYAEIILMIESVKPIEYTYSREGHYIERDFTNAPIYHWYIRHVKILSQKRSKKTTMRFSKQPHLSKQKIEEI